MVTAMSKNDLLRESTKKEDDKIRHITFLNPNIPDLKNSLKKYEGILSFPRKEAFTLGGMLVTYARSSKIKCLSIRGSVNNTPLPKICNPKYRNC